MKLKNNSKNNLIHMEGRTKHFLKVGEVVEVPEVLAKVWLNIPGIEEVKEVEEVKETKSTKGKKSSK